MKNTAHRITSESAFAHIQAQDVAIAIPIREYLYHHGCDVEFNTFVSGKPTYEICIGDGDFVKAFFDRVSSAANKKLAIVYGDDAGSAQKLTLKGIKVYYIDPKPPTTEQTKDIFSFFFVGSVMHADTRKDLERTSATCGTKKEVSREPIITQPADNYKDQERIASAMRDIFKKPQKHGKTKQRRNIGYVVLVLFTAFISPAILYCISLVFGTVFLMASGKLMVSGNIQWSQTLRQLSTPHITNAQSLLEVMTVFTPKPMLGYAEDQEKLIAMMSSTAMAQRSVSVILAKSTSIAESIFMPQTQQSDTTIADVMALSSEVSRVSQHLALIQAELEALLLSTRFPFSTVGVQDIGNKGKSGVYKLRSVIQFTQRLLTLYPQMGGFRKKQQYLILLQNSMELRPTGGFIGSVGRVTFSDGIMEDMQIIDVYEIDGQLKGHVDPPLPIREILGQEHWYLRDSNWNPDFSVSGETAAWFFEKETGDTVDGVIAVSLPVLTRLLHVLGSVDLPDFNERITESNFYAKSLLYTQADFFPGSTQKKDFLGSLVTALILRLTADQSMPENQLLQMIVDSIDARDIQFYFRDTALKQLVQQWGWAGAMDIAKCVNISTNDTCVGDGIAVVEANVGINKANYFVRHEGLTSVTISQDGSIDQVTTLNIKNVTPQETPEGGGAYHTYMRIYVPAGTVVKSVRLDGFDVPSRDTGDGGVLSEPYLVVEPTGYVTVIGLPFTVEPGHVRSLVVETQRVVSELAQGGAYQFSIRKQAGVLTYPWHVVVQYPPTWQAISEIDVAKPGIVEYNTSLEKDAQFRILFQQ